MKQEAQMAGKRSASKQPGLVPMYGIDKKTGKKVIKYWYEPPGTYKGKYAKKKGGSGTNSVNA